MIKPHISIYLDTRRAKANNLYPVKLRVFISKGKQRTQKLYPLEMDLTKEAFERSYNAAKPRKEDKDLKLKLLTKEQRAVEVADSLSVFTFEKFERELFREKQSANDAVYHYKLYIKDLIDKGKITTASNYDLSLKSLLDFVNSKGKGKATSLFFDSVTVDFLQCYERWMLAKERSRTTVGIYLRPLRAIFNNAIESGDIHKDLYPFGKRKYQIPAGRNIKKAFNKEQLGTLFRHDTLIPEQEKARDFWFFSYACNGMNIKDIANLRYSDLSGDSIVFSRAKTIDTTKANHKPIVVSLSEFPLSVIKKYGNIEKNPSNYIFPILTKDMNAQEQDRAVKNFTRFINQHIKKLAKTAKLPEEISTYYARHSFATNAIRNGASMEMIQESLGHSNLKTTLNYWGGFEDDIKREIAGKLMDF
jgi:integrase/recombinase XerD